MKKLLLLLSLFLLYNTVFSQANSKEYFLQKSKTKKTTAWILLGAGTTAIIAGALSDKNNRGEENSYTGGFLIIGGVISSLVSVPFFISASKHKKRAAAIAFRHNKILVPFNNTFTQNKQASVSLVISLTR